MTELPNKSYQIIYADPPWKYDTPDCLQKNSCLSSNSISPYPSMSLKEICNLPIKKLTDKNCLLFIWTTGPKLNQVFRVIKSWGFSYCTVAFVWEKIRVNPGYYTLSSTEFCLVGRKGNIPLNRGKRNVPQFYRELKTNHSRKPDGIRTLIKDMFPKVPKIELFARDHHEGWDVWGNETPGTNQQSLIEMPIHRLETIPLFILSDLQTNKEERIC